MEGPKTLIPGARSYLVKQLGQTLTLKTLITMFYIHHQGSGLAAVRGISKSQTLNNNNNIHQQRRCGLQKVRLRKTYCMQS